MSRNPFQSLQDPYTLPTFAEGQEQQLKLQDLKRKDVEARKKEQDAATIRKILSAGLTDDETSAQLRLAVPDAGLEFDKYVLDKKKTLASMDDIALKKNAAEAAQRVQTAQALLDSPRERWPEIAAQLGYQGQLDPDLIKASMHRDMKDTEYTARLQEERLAQEAKRPKAVGPPFLGYGNIRYQPMQQPTGDLQSVPVGMEAPEIAKPGTVTDKEKDFQAFLQDPAAMKKYPATRTGYERFQSDLIKSRQVPQTVIVQTVDAEGKPVTRIVPKTPGSEFETAPTADMRNRQAARSLVGKSIDAIQKLGDSIITRVGPAQRADAIKRGAEAVFGNDPSFRTYQDARMALAGNLAVGQQGSRPSDADIKAIWLPLVPDAYRDTSESAKMKWDLIKLMSNVDAVTDQAPIEDLEFVNGKLQPAKKK